MKKFMSKAKQKLACKKGDSHFLAIAVSIIIVVLVSTFTIPRVMKTTEKQADKVDSSIDSMWNYK